MRLFISLIDSRNYARGALVFLLLPMTFAATEKTLPGAIIDSEAANPVDISSLFLNKDDLSNLKEREGLIFGTVEKVRKGKIMARDDLSYLFMFNTGSTTITVYYTATSTFVTGSGERITLNDIYPDSWVYIFGNMSSDNSTMLATKIVTANKIKSWIEGG